MSGIALIVPGMHEPPGHYNVIITVPRDDGQLPDPVTFQAEGDRAAWRRSASIVSAHTADQIISIVTVHAPDRYAAVAVAHAVVSDALQQQGLSPSQPAGDAAVVRRLHEYRLTRIRSASGQPSAREPRIGKRARLSAALS